MHSSARATARGSKDWATADAVRDGLLSAAQTSALRKFINRSTYGLASSTQSNKVKVNESTTS